MLQLFKHGSSSWPCSLDRACCQTNCGRSANFGPHAAPDRLCFATCADEAFSWTETQDQQRGGEGQQVTRHINIRICSVFVCFIIISLFHHNKFVFVSSCEENLLWLLPIARERGNVPARIECAQLVLKVDTLLDFNLLKHGDRCLRALKEGRKLRLVASHGRSLLRRSRFSRDPLIRQLKNVYVTGASRNTASMISKFD